MYMFDVTDFFFFGLSSFQLHFLRRCFLDKLPGVSLIHVLVSPALSKYFYAGG